MIERIVVGVIMGSTSDWETLAEIGWPAVLKTAVSR